MKILELRFQNLNSLYGEWFIDFSTPEFASNGIFAITGPTGAGKSTILDAICLALYGATPRLGKITKNSNQLMSQQTAECFAEVTFESQQGRFTCHWSQHKARKKINGTLGESKHEISDTLSGQILESKKRDVALVIEEKTGMDFERFTRSILLAQGGFAAFLMATADERAPILEQITGTEIYSELSKRVHEKTREERERLNLLLAELNNITVLSDEEEALYQEELAAKKAQEAQLANEAQQLNTSINWLVTMETLTQELVQLAKEEERFNKELISFAADRSRLAEANKAMELDGLYATLKELRKQQSSDQSALAIEDLKIPELHNALNHQKEQLNTAERKFSTMKCEQKELAETLKKVRHLDQQLIDKQQTIMSYQRDIEKNANEISVTSEKLKQKQQAIDLLKEQQIAIATYIKNHAEDAALISQLTGIEEQLKTILALQTSLVEQINEEKHLKQQVNTRQVALEHYIQQESEQHNQLTAIQTCLNQTQGDLNLLLGTRLLREYRTEKDNLLREMAFLQKIASLESERDKLEDGKPCPLCGSEAHPYAQNNIPQIHETEVQINALTQLIHQAEDLEQQIQRIKAEEEHLKQKASESAALKTNAEYEKNQAEKDLQESDKQKNLLLNELNAREQEAGQKVRPFGILEITHSNAKQISTTLKTRLNNWTDKEKERTSLENKYNELHGDLKPLEAIITTLKSSLSEQQQNIQLLHSELTSIRQERTQLFGTKMPDEEETQIEHKLQNVEQVKNLVQEQMEQITRNVAVAQMKIHTLKEQITRREPQLIGLENEFNTRLKHLEFHNENTFLSLYLPADQRNSLTEQAKLLDTKKTSLIAKINDRNERLSIEQAKIRTEARLDELRPLLELTDQNISQVRERMTTLFIELKNHNEHKQQSATKKAIIAQQKIECMRMDKLHQLIGSSDGKKFRNFAQGLTFELMVNHANKQLGKMTDRYLLIRDEAQPLELNVVDNYQAGEIRTTKNLSGGESFIVSLSLALGLSKMASQKVRVDSLFLDEGFGTLDDDALETALETLGELQQDGKIIGIISHVHALKERISTQINVQPVSGGKSAISGPGCQFMVR